MQKQTLIASENWFLSPIFHIDNYRTKEQNPDCGSGTDQWFILLKIDSIGRIGNTKKIIKI